MNTLIRNFRQIYRRLTKQKKKKRKFFVIFLTDIVFCGLMDKNVARKLFNPLFYLPLQLFEKMNKKFAFTVVAK